MAAHRQSIHEREVLSKIDHVVHDHLAVPQPEVEADAYNFTVYAAFWRKKEMKEQVAQDAQAAAGQAEQRCTGYRLS